MSRQKIFAATLLSVVFVGTFYFLMIKGPFSTQKSLGKKSSLETTIAASDLIYSDSTSLDQKIEIVKKLKGVSEDVSLEKSVRVKAGEEVVATFFEFGPALSKGFSDKPFSERDVFEYAKYINTLGDSKRNSLFTAYIGLRFYSNEIDEKFVTDLLDSHQRYVNKYGDKNSCIDNSKIASIIYLAKKYKNIDLSDKFGTYYERFQNAFHNFCSPEVNSVTAFMWLAAISDIGGAEVDSKQVKELLDTITKDTTENSPLVMNLKSSYFSSVQEPDTVSIVERLATKYPEFKMFIDELAKRYKK